MITKRFSLFAFIMAVFVLFWDARKKKQPKLQMQNNLWFALGCCTSNRQSTTLDTPKLTFPK